MSTFTMKITRRRPLRTGILSAIAWLFVSHVFWGGAWAASPRAGASRTSARRAATPDSSTHLLFSIQVASLSKKPNAEALFKKLVQLGYDAYMDSAASAGSEADYRIKVGKYRDLSEMSPVMARLRKDGFSPVIAQYKETTWAADQAANPAPAAQPAANPAGAASAPGEKAAAAPAAKAAVSPAPAPSVESTSEPAASATRSEKAKDAASESAAPDTAAAPGEDSWVAGGVKVLHTVGALAFVLALILGAYYLVRRFNPERLGKRSKERLMRSLDSMVLGDKKTLMLVEVSGDKYLLAATPSDVCLLAKIEPSALPRPTATAPEPAAVAASPDFATLLSLKKAELAKSSAASAASAASTSTINHKIREANKTIGF